MPSWNYLDHGHSDSHPADHASCHEVQIRSSLASGKSKVFVQDLVLRVAFPRTSFASTFIRSVLTISGLIKTLCLGQKYIRSKQTNVAAQISKKTVAHEILASIFNQHKSGLTLLPPPFPTPQDGKELADAMVVNSELKQRVRPVSFRANASGVSSKST